MHTSIHTLDSNIAPRGGHGNGPDWPIRGDDGLSIGPVILHVHWTSELSTTFLVVPGGIDEPTCLIHKEDLNSHPFEHGPIWQVVISWIYLFSFSSLLLVGLKYL